MGNLPTDYKDDILSPSMYGKRIYQITWPNGTTDIVSLIDVTEYEQVGSEFGAKDINETNKAVNEKLPLAGGVLNGPVIFDKTSTGEGMVKMTDSDGNVLELLRVNFDGLTLILNDDMYTEGKGGLNLCAGDVIRLITSAERIVLEKSTTDTHSAYFRPYNDNKCTLGTASKRFYGLWAGNSTVQTSDAREKENVIPLGVSPIASFSMDETTENVDIHSELFDRLQPVQYNLIEGNTRTCYGLIEQDVIAAMEELGIDENELDLVHHEFHKGKCTIVRTLTF